jgi:hypothetical protein
MTLILKTGEHLLGTPEEILEFMRTCGVVLSSGCLSDQDVATEMDILGNLEDTPYGGS